MLSFFIILERIIEYHMPGPGPTHYYQKFGSLEETYKVNLEVVVASESKTFVSMPGFLGLIRKANHTRWK